MLAPGMAFSSSRVCKAWWETLPMSNETRRITASRAAFVHEWRVFRSIRDERPQWDDGGMVSESVARTPVLIFDGDCAFCTTAVRWLDRVLPAMPASSPYQRTDLAAYGLTTADGQSRVWLVAGGRRYGGAAAVAALLRRQPAPALRMLGWLGTVPPWSWAAELSYRLIARYRHRLPGGTPACRLEGGA